MRSVLFIAFIFIFHVESVSICEFCDCQEKSDLTGLMSVNCSHRENVFENGFFVLNASTSLDLTKSNLTVIPSNAFQSNTLHELFLQGNLICEIKQDSFQLPELIKLDLSENELVFINADLFKGITKLEYLNLASNKFTAVSQLNFAPLVNLKEIILDNNDIGSDIAVRSLFDVEGYGLPSNIENLSISGINLKDLNSEYFMPVNNSLKKLVITNNTLTKLFKIPERIEYLDVSNNPIKNISKENFPYNFPLIYIRALKLNNLDIEKVDKNVFSAVMLTTLEMENNKNLREFSNLTFGRQVLFDHYDFTILNLTLKGSSLTTLDESLSVLFRRLRILDLQQNPWVCDCRLAWILRLPIHNDLIEDLRCALPPYLHNRRIFDLDEKDFVCLTSWWQGTHIGITVGLVLYMSLVFVTLTWIYVFIYVPKAQVNKQEYTQIR